MTTARRISSHPSFVPIAAGVAALLLTWASPRPTHASAWFFVLAALWLCYLVGALAGWGSLIARALLPGRSLDWSLEAALGLAGAVVGGGVLNLAAAISRPLLLALLASGFALLVADLWPRRASLTSTWRERLAALRGDRARAALLAVFAVLTALQVAGSLHGAVNTVSTYRDFDVHDDYQAYLVFPEKMLQLGALGPEPFDARRMICLGGQSFLQTLVLAELPLRALHLLDGGVAWLIALGLLAGALRNVGVRPRLSALVLLFATLIPTYEARGNTTAVLTGVALLLAWFRLAAETPLGRGHALRNAIVTALLASALCALKPTFIPVAALFFAITSLASSVPRETRRAALGESALAAVLVFVLLAPWMIALYQSSGTPLYPIFGKGYFGSVYTHDFAAVKGDFAIPAAEMLEHIRRNLGRIVPILALLLLVRERAPRRPVLAIALTAALATIVLVLVNDPYLDRSIYRYCFPVVAAAMLAVVAASLAEDQPGAHQPVPLIAAVLGALLLVFASPLTIFDACARQPVSNLASAVSGRPLVGTAEVEEMRALQEAVPPGATVLTRVPYPFLFDFRRNPIRVHSLPGMASPPPGLPTMEGGEPVARYLAGQGIRYLAYGARTDQLRLLNLSEADIANRYPRSRVRWTMLTYHRDFEKSVLELAVSRRHLADNEQSFVLDLEGTRVQSNAALPAATVRPEQLADKTGVLADNNWTTGDAVLRGMRLAVPAGHHRLTIAIGAAHPFRADVARLAVRAWANGRELTFAGNDGPVLLFSIPDETTVIDELRVTSSTFVPRRLGLNQDDRTLGIPIEWISTRP